MKTKKLFVLLAIVSMTLALFINCGGGGGADDPLPIPNPLPTLKISEATQISTTGAAFSIEVGRVSSGFTESGIIVGGTKIKLEPASSASYTMTLGLLATNTSYSVKGYAVVPEGTAYSNEVSFKTNEVLAKITDVDGNKINIVKIGTQTWTAEDWKAIHYRDGSPIIKEPQASFWEQDKVGSYCYYNNDPKNTSVLYNWYAMTNSKSIAPIGWHVATKQEWTVLSDYLKPDAGNKLKEVGNSHWLGDNSLATNSSGFTAIPTGYRGLAGDNTYQISGGTFLKIGYEAIWWCNYLPSEADIAILKYNEATIHPAIMSTESLGCAIRLVKDK